MFHKISLVSIVSWPRRGKFLTNIYCHKHLIDKKLHGMLGKIVRIVLTFSRKKVFCPGSLDGVCTCLYMCGCEAGWRYA